MAVKDKLNKSRVHSLYVSLDSLLDTRFAILVDMLGEKIAETPIEVYYKRTREEFAGVDSAEFAKRYAARDVSVLRKSVVTGILRLIKDFCSKAEQELANGARMDSAFVYINTWPYVLSEEETTDIVDSVSLHISSPVKVKTLHLSPTELSAKFCKATFSSMVMYDYNDWMNAQFDAVKIFGPIGTEISQTELMRVQAEIAMPSVDLFVPSLFRGDPITDEQIAIEVKAGMHPFRGLEINAQPLIKLKVIDTKHFCIHD